jgi:hypothetical protein
MGGNAIGLQSFPEPRRTTSALVRAAKVMAIAARPTQIPVRAGSDGRSVTARKSASRVAGGDPPFPLGGCSILGGSWIVVAILLLCLFFPRTLQLVTNQCAQRLCFWVAQPFYRCGYELFFDRGFSPRSSPHERTGTFSGEFCIMKSTLAPSTEY